MAAVFVFRPKNFEINSQISSRAAKIYAVHRQDQIITLHYLMLTEGNYCRIDKT